jgi:hypothetical protein
MVSMSVASISNLATVGLRVISDIDSQLAGESSCWAFLSGSVRFVAGVLAKILIYDTVEEEEQEAASESGSDSGAERESGEEEEDEEEQEGASESGGDSGAELESDEEEEDEEEQEEEQEGASESGGFSGSELESDEEEEEEFEYETEDQIFWREDVCWRHGFNGCWCTRRLGRRERDRILQEGAEPPVDD